MLEKEIINANKQCDKIKNYIKEHEDMFNAMDLKLHDASYYEFEDMKNDFLEMQLCQGGGLRFFFLVIAVLKGYS